MVNSFIHSGCVKGIIMDVRIPPHNLDAEKAVLGALLTNGSNMGAVVDTVTSILKSEDFYRDAHRIIYDAILEIVHANKTADFITVGEELDRRKRLDAVGGLAYITSLANESVSYNVEEHAKIISEKAQLRRLIDAGNKIVGMTYAGEDEPTAILNKAEQMVLDVSGQTQSESSFAAIGEVVLSNLDKLNALQQHDGAITGVPTGFKDVDHVFNGLQKSDLILVAARPAMGKTAFILSMARNITVEQQIPMALFSLEMASVQLITRMIASETRISSEKLRKGTLNDDEWQRLFNNVSGLEKAPLFIDETPSLSIFDFRAKCRRLVMQHGVKIIMVDYLQLMTANSGGKGGNREQEISTISRSLKAIAKELNVPIIALSQLSRSVENRPDKRPQLSDLRESGAIEQDADIVSFIYRPEYYKFTEWPDGTPSNNQAELIIAKHRNGAVTDVRLSFHSQYAKFGDLGTFENYPSFGISQQEQNGFENIKTTIDPSAAFNMSNNISGSAMNDDEDDMPF